MKENIIKTQNAKQYDASNGIPFSSNDVCLNTKQWRAAIIIVLLLILLLPVVWPKFENFSLSENERFPNKLSNEYWLYEQYCQKVCGEDINLVIGDSVVWGQYVEKDQTLSHYLNEQAGEENFVNMGLDGLHPAALYGLMKYYGGDIKDKKIILHFNPLWISSEKHDLQTSKEFSFNHPELVPQFFPRIPCYYASTQKRLQNVIARRISFFSWVKHLQLLYFSSADEYKKGFTNWIIKNPYKCPFEDIDRRLVPLFTEQGPAVNIKVNGESSTIKTNLPWVNITESIQWYYFKNTVRLLQKRGNKVFVVVGPFNEHILDEDSLAKYRIIKEEVASWLEENKIDYFLPESLPVEYYADASHPIAAGYALLAERIFQAGLWDYSID